MIARRLLTLEALRRFEPLAVFIHQGDGGDRDAKEPGRQPRDAVEALLARRVEHQQGSQRREAQNLVGWLRRFVHGRGIAIVGRGAALMASGAGAAAGGCFSKDPRSTWINAFTASSM